MVRIKQGPKGGKYIIVNGRKKYLPKSSSKKKLITNFGSKCEYSDNYVVSDRLPQFSWHMSWCQAEDPSDFKWKKFLHVTGFYSEFRGISAEPPSVHYGYKVQNLTAGPGLWYNSGWEDLRYGVYASIIEEFIKFMFESVPDKQIIE